MKYTLIRHAKDETKLKWTSDNDAKDDHLETELVSGSTPEPDFVRALQALKPDVLELCELPKGWAEDFEIRSVTFRQVKDRYGVLISGSKKLERATRPLNVTTPLMMQAADGDADGKKGLIQPELQTKLDALITAAEAFRKGERAQQELELEGKRRTGRQSELTPIEDAAGYVPPKNGKAEPAPEDGTETVDEAIDEAKRETEKAEARAEASKGVPLDEYASAKEQLEAEGIEYGTPIAAFVDELTPTVIGMLKHRDVKAVGELARERPNMDAWKGFGPKALERVDAVLELYRDQPAEMPV